MDIDHERQSPLYAFLKEKLCVESTALEMYRTIEETIVVVLRDYFGAGYKNISDLTDIALIEEYRKKIKIHTILKVIDNQREPRFTEALKWYRLFIKSTKEQDDPISLAPEEPITEKQPTRENSSTKIRTIFSEGELEESLPKEVRERNMALRRACISYFKSIHNGELICECCGFNYSKAYKIEDEYIEIHHRFPISQTEGEHLVNAETDLVPLCANCHRMIHHGQGGKGNCISVEELKQLYIGKDYRKE